MAAGISVLIDDQSTAITYLCPSQKQTVPGSYYNNTRTTVDSSKCGMNGWFQYSFLGTAVQILVSSNNSQNYSVNIDGSSFPLQDSSGYFESPTLNDGQHTVTYAVEKLDHSPEFDYLTVTPGSSTILTGKTIAVDDVDDTLTYQGAWSTETPSGFNNTAKLFRTTAHWSSTVGDSVELYFGGSTVSVYGVIINGIAERNVSVMYTVNDIPFNSTVTNVTLDTLPMAQLFHLDLEPGNHTLAINVTDISPSQAIGFDYITYSATFANISSIPTAPQPSGASDAQVRRSLRGALVGGVIGIVVLIAALVVGYIVSKRSPHAVRWRLKPSRTLGSRELTLEQQPARKQYDSFSRDLCSAEMFVADGKFSSHKEEKKAAV
ncbi:hypothetical protein BDQ17DRAFT_1270841 [Cyathus striatus]|nr:hypothetical protein BDQ17DRAFT_1270841 [Cyathus striatus]